MLRLNVGVSQRAHHTFQLHEVWAVAVDHSEQCSSVTNISHQVFQKWEEWQLFA